MNDVERAFREEGPAVLATLIRHVGDFELAEDAVQDALAAAVATLAARRRPREPGRLDHHDGAAQGDRPAAPRARGRRRVDRLLGSSSATPRRCPRSPRSRAVADDRLRLIFTCCHPALSLDAQVALTLRLLGGLTTAEIARAFLVPRRRWPSVSCAPSARSPTARIPYRVPARRRAARAHRGVLAVVYLIFNEGYVAAAAIAGARRAVQRGDPARSPARAADAGRTRGARPAGADAPA